MCSKIHNNQLNCIKKEKKIQTQIDDYRFMKRHRIFVFSLRLLSFYFNKFKINKLKLLMKEFIYIISYFVQYKVVI